MSRNKNKKQNSTTARSIKQLKEVNGLFTCLMDHTVSKSEIQFKWTGPKIPEAEWRKVLAFFQWTYDTTHSESQVRLYVNRITKVWTAWAFPQEAKTGMSARELDNADAATQRERFNPSEGWMYFGTVHHHCSMGAFQSGVDLANEQNQDGLHITVGKLAADRYDMHERFYLNGQKIEIDLEWFWDIGNEVTKLPQWAQSVLPEDIEDRLARGQMCVKVTADETFPEEWKTNLVYQKPIVTVSTSSYSPSIYSGVNYQSSFQRKHTNTEFDMRSAYTQLQVLCKEEDMTIEEAVELMGQTESLTFIAKLINLMYRNDVSLDKFIDYIIGEAEEEEKKSLNEELKQTMIGEGSPPNKKDDTNGRGMPSYEAGNPYQHWSDNGM